jgi:hypothetical protein
LVLSLSHFQGVRSADLIWLAFLEGMVRRPTVLVRVSAGRLRDAFGE